MEQVPGFSDVFKESTWISKIIADPRYLWPAVIYFLKVIVDVGATPLLLEDQK
jgi:hypothetical protein